MIVLAWLERGIGRNGEAFVVALVSGARKSKNETNTEKLRKRKS